MAFVLLPHQTPHWKVIKHTLTHILEERLTIFQLISHLDRVENLTHFGQLTDHLLDDLPRRKTFFNLGGFLCGLSSNERHHFQNSVLPFLLRCVIDLEHLWPEYLLCDRKQKECDTFVPFHLVTSVIACAFLCLLRTRWNSVIPFDEVNFAKFFERLIDTRFNHDQKLFSLITYFDHCRQSTVTNAAAVLRVIRRHLSVSLPSRLPDAPTVDLPAQPLPGLVRHILIRALRNVPLPCLFTDRCNRPTAVADDFHIPLAFILAEGRDRGFRGLANTLSWSIVRGAIRTVKWGDQCAKVVLSQAMTQASEHLVSTSLLGRNQRLLPSGRGQRRRYRSVLFSPYPILRCRSAEEYSPTLDTNRRKPHCTRHQSRTPFSPSYIRSLEKSVRLFPQVKQFKCCDASTVGPNTSQTSTLKPNAVDGLSPFDPKSHPHLVEIQISDRLNRFAESLASGCCVSAMHTLQSRWLRAKGLDPDCVRPSGFVTTGWNKYTVNPTGDPQLKVLTQWIAAAAATASVTVKNRDPLIGTSNSQTSVGFAGEESPFAWEYHISPVVVCTNNDPRLEQLGAVVRLVYSTDCSAGTLLSLLCDYAAYRRGSTGVQFQSESSLFDYLLERLHTSTGPSISS
ncbi:hypothetical protein P879_05419 [Paragonimus westermani]|uniref:PARG helical domain-containing protein n=1 Tax=Paragonimus westermani TaxID=34504 RepID=A0A8T0DSV9_9TREM|nr:hypothetical protein P879_05419 [Paragonimus westermani]